MIFMVFDVESIGLHGEGYSVGWVVIDSTGAIHEEGIQACHPKFASGKFDGHNWAMTNSLPENCQHGSPEAVRMAFWERWMAWKQQDALLAADCPWPVEARFLMDCVRDDSHDREWDGPYPFIDIASVLMATGKDPTQTYPRLPNELPIHNPLCDSRQSARMLIEAIKSRPKPT